MTTDSAPETGGEDDAVTTDDLGLLATGAVRVGGGAATDAGARELIVATGADRIRFLHGIVTGNVAGTPVGGGCRSALLTPKGHVVADMRIFVRPDDVWIVVGAGLAAPTAAALSRYAIMDDFTAVPRAGFTLMSLLGPTAATRLAAIGIAPADPLGELAARSVLSHATLETSVADADRAGALWLVRVRELGVDGFWVGGDTGVLAAVDARLAGAGVPRLGAHAAEVARIAAREPKEGSEITSDYFPMEVGLDEAIDYSKGCYLGQEPIVRIRDRGHINWRLVGLDIEGPHDPAPQDAIESDAKPKAGRVTSAARLPGGPGIALALVHVSVPEGSQVRVKHGDEIIAARVRTA
jgi:folate-binding protein YgfZ